MTMKKIVFDVGAFDGVSSVDYANKLLKDIPPTTDPSHIGFHCYMFEPHPSLAENLRWKFEKVADVFSTIETAVCEFDGETQLHLSRPVDWADDPVRKIGGSCSILEFKTDDEIAKGWSNSTALEAVSCPDRTDLRYSGQSVTVKTTRMDTFIKENAIERIDFLHIDAQGCDLEVLKSFGEYIKIIQEGICEGAPDAKSAIYKTQKYFLDDIVEWLIGNGFSVYEISPNVPYSADGKVSNEMNIKFRKKSQ